VTLSFYLCIMQHGFMSVCQYETVAYRLQSETARNVIFGWLYKLYTLFVEYYYKRILYCIAIKFKTKKNKSFFSSAKKTFADMLQKNSLCATKKFSQIFWTVRHCAVSAAGGCYGSVFLLSLLLLFDAFVFAWFHWHKQLQQLTVMQKEKPKCT